jgi:hypothetical protein
MKDNDAAADLWSQIFARAAAHPWAAIVDPDHDEAGAEEFFRQALRDAGWSDDEIDARREFDKARIDTAPVTSPGANPYVEAALGRLGDDIEAAMDRLGLDSHHRVARGVDPWAGPGAAKTGVIMTDQSIITVSSFLFRFCGLIARAFTRTLQLNPWAWSSEEFDSKTGRDLIRGAPDIASYWMLIYFSFATSGTHAAVPFRPSTKEEVILMEQVARAMELFALAHEYGHHHLAHGKEVDADPFDQEFAADQFAVKIGEEIDRKPVILENPYLLSGAGGTILLMALDILRSIERFAGAPAIRHDTHPPVSERIARFDSVRVLKPVEFKWLKEFRVTSERIMTAVEEMLLPPLEAMSKRELSDLRKLRETMRAPPQST